MSDINNKINEVVVDYMASDEMKKAVKEKVKATIERELDSIFSYGKVRDKIKETLQENLNLDFRKVKFPELNQFVVEVVRNETLEVLKEQTKPKLIENLEKILKPAPKEILFQDFLDIVKKYVMSEAVITPDYTDSLEIEFKRHDGVLDGNMTVRIWDHEGKERSGSYSGENSPLLHIYFNDGGKIGIIHRGSNVKMPTNNFGLEEELYLMYCQGTKFTDLKEVSEYDLDLNFSLEEDY